MGFLSVHPLDDPETTSSAEARLAMQPNRMEDGKIRMLGVPQDTKEKADLNVGSDFFHKCLLGAVKKIL